MYKMRIKLFIEYNVRHINDNKLYNKRGFN